MGTDGTNLLGHSKSKKILIFNCTSGRSGLVLLGSLLETIVKGDRAHQDGLFDEVVFCTNTTYSSGTSKPGASSLHSPMRRLVIKSTQNKPDLTSLKLHPEDVNSLAVQKELQQAYIELTSTEELKVAKIPDEKFQILGSIEEAVNYVRTQGEVEALVTGSLLMVGGLMEVAGVKVF
jgi:folylpolyglutamate synthase